MWSLNPIENKNYSCFHYGVASLASFYQCDYQMSMLELWGFKYDNRSSSIGQGLDLCWIDEVDRRRRLLNKFHGLDFHISANIDGDVIKFIDEKLKIAPLIVYVDSYDCCWLPFYKNQHLVHTIIIVGKHLEGYRFIDQYLVSISNNVVEGSFIAEHYQKIVIFNYFQKPALEPEDYLNELKNCVDLYRQNNSLIQYEDFFNDIKNKFDIAKEIPYKDPLGSELVMKLKYIGEDRVNLIEALNYINQYIGISHQKCNEILFSISQKYEKLRAYMIKSVFTNKLIDSVRVQDEVQNLFHLEKEVLALLDKILFQYGEKGIGKV